MLTQKDLKREVYMQKGSLSIKELFLSVGYGEFLTQMAEGITECNYHVSSILFCGEKDSIAYTDGHKININYDSMLATGLNKPERHLLYCGLNLHECGHVLFTDFSLHERILSEMAQGRIYPTPAKNNYLESLRAFIEVPGNYVYIAKLFSVLDNCIEDGFVDRAVMKQAPGYAKCLRYVNQIDRSTDARTYQDMQAEGMDNISIFINLTLSYARHGLVLFPDDFHDDLTDIFRQVIPTINSAVFEPHSLQRKKNVWTVFCYLFHFFEQQASGQQGQEGGQQQGSGIDQGNNRDASQQQASGQQCQEGGQQQGSGIDRGQENNQDASQQQTSGQQGQEGGQQQSSGADQENSQDASQQQTSGQQGQESGQQQGSGTDRGQENNQDASQQRTSGQQGQEGGQQQSSGADQENSQDASQQQTSGQQGQENRQRRDDGTEQKTQSKSDRIDIAEKLKKMLKEVGESISDSEKSQHKNPTVPSDEVIKELSRRMKNGEEIPSPSAISDIDPESYLNELDKIADKVVLSRICNQQEKEIQSQMGCDIKTFLDDTNYHRNVDAITIRADISASAQKKYDQLHSELDVIVKRLLSEFQREINERQMGDTLTGLYTGKQFNARDAHRYDKRVMRRKIAPEDIPNMGVGILIDISGSMKGERLETSIRCAYITYQFCCKLQIPCFIIGHTTSGNKVRLVNVCDEKSLDKKDPLRIFSLTAHENNRDGYAVWFCMKKLERIVAEQKLLLIISDGKPNHNGYGFESGRVDCQAAVKYGNKKGIVTIAAAIGDPTGVRSIYKKDVSEKGSAEFLDLTDLQRLPKALVKIIKRRLE